MLFFSDETHRFYRFRPEECLDLEEQHKEQTLLAFFLINLFPLRY